MRKSVIALLTGLTLSLTAQADFATKYINKETVNIVQFGDEHTDGNVFPNYLRMELSKYNPNTRLHYYGKNGAVWFNLAINRPNWKEIVEQHKTDLVIFAFGTNESLSEVFFSDSHQKKWLEFIAYLKDQNIDVLLLSSPTVYAKGGMKECKTSPNLEKVIEKQRETAKATRSYFWDWYKALGGNDCGLLQWQKEGFARNDGIHLNTAGYKKLAKMLADDLKKFLKIEN